MPRIVLLVLVALVVGLGVTACGGDGDSDTTATETTATTGTETGEAVDGAAVFSSAGCGGCHTLAAAGTSGSVGPNLDDLQPDAATVEAMVRNGGGAMPSFEGDLSDAEIAAVAEYVASSAGTG